MNHASALIYLHGHKSPLVTLGMEITCSHAIVHVLLLQVQNTNKETNTQSVVHNSMFIFRFVLPFWGPISGQKNAAQFEI